MNQHLQKILDFIQQADHLSAEEKADLLKSTKDADKELEITAFKLDRVEKVKRTTAILLEETIEELQQKRKAVEAQNKELEIESSLERVRTVAMSMNKVADMLEVCRVISGQLELLNVREIRNVQTAIIYESKGSYLNFEYYTKHDKTFITNVDFQLHPAQFEFVYKMLKGPEEFFSRHFTGTEVQDWHEYQKTTNQFADSFLTTASSLNYYWYSMGPVALGMSTYTPLTDEEIILFKRFRNVFDLAYRRFLDIEKAEAQAREARIEAALEKVRSRSLAMHKSDELQEVANTLFERLKELDIKVDSANIAIFKEGTRDYDYWVASSAQKLVTSFHIPYTNLSFTRDLIAARESGSDFSSKVYSFEEKNEWFIYAFEHTDFKLLSDERKQFILNAKAALVSIAFAKSTGIQVTNYSGELLSESEADILKRFSKVFEQAYTRFLDLQKAEAQVREAKIESALERTRTQSMIMQHSNELDDTLRVFHEQVLLLGINSAFSFLWLPDEKNDRHIFWAAWAENISPTQFIDHTTTAFNSKAIDYPLDRNDPATTQCLVDWKGNEPIVSYHVQPTGVKSYFLAWQELIDGVENLKPENFSDGLYYVEAFMKYGCFGVMVTNDLTADEKKILGRFATEFERTYRRFLDLQKAEVQAREAQIEGALERVRSRTMAMHKSEELFEVINVLSEQLQRLDFKFDSASFAINNNSDDLDFWLASPGQPYPAKIYIPYVDQPVMNNVNQAKKNGLDFFADLLSLQEKNEWLQHLFTNTSLKHIPEERKKFLLETKGFGRSSILMKHVTLAVVNYDGIQYAAEENAIFKRFANVFEQSYMRFLDLQKAEAQARESQIEAALERVRSKAMSMQQSEDLSGVVATVFEELDKLNMEMLRCGIGILHKQNRSADVWTTTISENNSVVQVSGVESMDIHPLLQGAFAAWLLQEDYSYVLKGMDLREYYKALINQNFLLPASQSLVTEEESKVQYYYNATFTSGGLFAFRESEFPQETKIVLRRFADAFNFSYTRFNDLKQAEKLASQAQQDLINLKTEKKRAEVALTELRSTQTQLIQSEKMASLGELTAGIAHEIQNPLNFVNNFSEVSSELIEEMVHEVGKGNSDEVKIIADDLKKNLEKILYHGKRAADIVKGMLQHSRSSTSRKELTDINKLADEYLRLAYHGLRAKDKSFNATLKTDFDENIGNVLIVPQDIGRVILNLITNAFYAVSEKKKQLLPAYEPTISVMTKRILKKDGDKVIITIEDNGDGIPQKVVDKIFQPFFTTKPTGQGTGLGLSLSYDIVKAHGGELKVEAIDGEGAAFKIILPLT